MSDPKMLVLHFYQLFDTNQLEAIRELASSDFAAELNGLPRMSFDQFLKFGQRLRVAFPDGEHTFDQITVNGNEVITQGTFSGTHQGSFFGIAPTGKRIAIAVQHLDRVEHNQLIYHFGKGDQFGIVRQLGIGSILTGLIKTLLRSPS